MKPYERAQSLPLKPAQDARRKLTEAQKDEIRQNRLGLSQHALARAYGVDRRTISFILDPDKLERMKAATLERVRRAGGWTEYNRPYDHTTAVRNLRRKKYRLYLAGELGE